VLALAEPYRSTVLLHFFEGLTSVEIAHRLGIPASTVRGRLKTALEQLRAQLKARTDQPRRGWLAALVPLSQAPASISPRSSILGALIVKKIIAAVIVLVLLVAGVVLWKSRGGGARGTSATGIALGPAGAPQQLRPVGNRHDIGRVPAWAMQADAPARMIAGHVISDGKPVARATVRLGLQVGADLVQPLAEVTSNADGGFNFGLQPAARFTVSAQAESHSSGSVTVANADPRAKSDNVVVELGDCHLRMDGTVFDASGGGIAKAHLSVDGLGGVDTDAAGRYSMCLSPRKGVWDTPQELVRVEADGYGTTTHGVILASAMHQDFVMVPEAVLVGRVVTADDVPVAGARVIAQPDISEGPHHVAANWSESDSDGHFRIAALAPGKFQLSATARAAGSAAPLLAIARPANTSQELRLVLVPLARVKGRVVMNGSPVEGAHVMAAHPGPVPGPQRGPTATSQADGTFTLDGVPFGTTQLSASPFSVTAPKALDIKQALHEGVVLEVSRLATLRGRVLRKGKPVAGAEVQYMPLTPQTVAATSNADGTFVLEGLPPGDGSIGAISVESKAWSAPRPVHLDAGEERAEDVVLDLAGEVLGTVVDESGKPVAGVYVRMDNPGDHCEAITGSVGEFDCPVLAGGEYTPAVAPSPSTGRGFAPAEGDKFATITVPQDGVVTGVTLAIKNERLAIRGTVVDDTGAAVPDVHVEVFGHDIIVSMGFASAMTDANGNFDVTNLARGPYSLHAHAANGSEAEVLNVAAGTDHVTIKLSRPGAIEGTLVGFSKTPTVETLLLLADLHIGGYAIVEGNHFSQIGLTPGKYTVEAKAGSETDGTAVEVRPGETAHVTLTSRGTGRVEGTVTELGTNAPIAGMRCDGNLSMGGQMGMSPPDESRQAFTDAAGHFSLTTPTGPVRVFCFPVSGPPISAAGIDVEVSAGRVPHVDLFAVRPTFTGPPPKIGFDLAPMNLPITVNTVDPGGPAAAAGIAPGDHVVTIDGQSLQGMLPNGAMILLFNHRAGSTITLGLERAGSVRTAKITVR
ncbi:MAG TPA: carboxypeptidase regulatory-like domain-containing protein, partial [Kofleriaceae bacterium]|nr:carboxypeptidase regulatory-like domain-containing protein [Kofleriaceae bacterium]